MVKTDSPSLYNLPTRFAVIKTDCPSFYKPHSCFAVVKTDFASFYNPPICFVEVKTDTANFLHALRWPNRTLQAFARSLYTRSAVVKTDKQASYTLRDCQNKFSKLLQASYMHCNCQNGSSKLLQVPYTLFGGQNVPRGAFASFLYALRLSKRTLCTCTIKPPTRIAEVKTGSPNAFWGSINGLSEQLQASYTLCGIQNWLYELQRG